MKKFGTKLTRMAAIGLTIAAGMAFADTASAEQLTGRGFTRTAVANVVPVGDKEGHILGVIKMTGLWPVSADEVVRLSYVANIDFTNGSGPFANYVVMAFPDGSTLVTQNSGTAEAQADGTTLYRDGVIKVISGTGRFANATGKGSFSGARLVAIPDGGDAYWDVVINLD